MSRRLVQHVMPISATAFSPPVAIGQTNSILSDPDGRWVAKRQGAINRAFEKRMRPESDQDVDVMTSAHDSSQIVALLEKPAAKLSGESDRIGRHEWDANTRFGKHVGFF
ncbi:hypothetical protein ASG25_09780 [Rhizobium sp. Leaf384]|uniref:hypothetical protein n=1 Tax=unclassified Rhizobium TaxID=2613769 RepID=UPI00071482D0|nr:MULTISPECIES: hypothetical protein [unclassified Rhizobium]KQS78890.1 hypothetical protein ASG25_09780 [Rhizobium sp. Leaf384]KQS85474.1 hypothetical protein ASG58_18785 [Rhizobium sp. Leaf383]